MSRLSGLVALISLLAVSGTAMAEGVVIPRLGAHLGQYEVEFSAPGIDADNDETAYGLETGLFYGRKQFVADLGLEFLDVDNFDITSTNLTLGWRFAKHWSAFAGYRYAWQGDGAFDDEFYTEDGPFIGIGLGGMPLADWGSWGLSVAYNDDEAEIADTTFDFTGISAKFLVSLRNQPIGLQLRYQQFEDDADEFDLKEDYLLLGVIWYIERFRL